MEKSMLIETIGDSIENQIIDFLLEGKGLSYSKKDIADGCSISRPTVYKILPRLIEDGIIREVKKIGRITLYILNENNQKVIALRELEQILLKRSFEFSEQKAIASV